MDFYLLLGVQREASDADIKRAYKRLARKYHPDINPGDQLAEQQFRRIAEAYETLIDPDRRRRYDVTGAEVPDAERVIATRAASIWRSVSQQGSSALRP